MKLVYYLFIIYLIFDIYIFYWFFYGRWVVNYYKWIVWKFVSYERCYLIKFMRKFFIILNVFDELKYR